MDYNKNNNQLQGNTPYNQFPNNSQQYIVPNYFTNYQTAYNHGTSISQKCNSYINYQNPNLQNYISNPFINQVYNGQTANQLQKQYSILEPQPNIYVSNKQIDNLNNQLVFSELNTMNYLHVSKLDKNDKSQQQILQQNNQFTFFNEYYKEQKKGIILNNSSRKNNNHIHFSPLFKNTDKFQQKIEIEDHKNNLQLEQQNINENNSISIQNEMELERSFERLNTLQIPHMIETQSQIIETQNSNLKLQTQTQTTFFQNTLTQIYHPKHDLNTQNQKDKDNQFNDQLQETIINDHQEKRYCSYKQIDNEYIQNFQIISEKQIVKYRLINNDAQNNVEIKQNVYFNQDIEQNSCIFDSNKNLQIINDQSNLILLNNLQVQPISQQLALSKNSNNIQQKQMQEELINLKSCSLSSIIEQYDLNDAFQIMKNSIFTQKKHLLFELKFSQCFKLNKSQTKNNNIVFSKIKESRRNNRCQNKNNSISPRNTSNQQINNQEYMKSEMSCNDKHSNTFSPKISSFESKQKKATSKFHNLKKLFMYKLLATFNQNNLIEIGVPQMIIDVLLKLIIKLKASAKKSEERKRKTEFFSQAHYNALFLFLNQKTISELAKKEYEVYLHKVIFSIDLEEIAQQHSNSVISFNKQPKQQNEKTESLNSIENLSLISVEEKIQYINILKHYCYQIVQSSNMFGVNSNKGNQCSSPSSQENQSQDPISFSDQQLFVKQQKSIEEITKDNKLEEMRMAYTYRALQGISSLNRGICVKKF